MTDNDVKMPFNIQTLKERSIPFSIDN